MCDLNGKERERRRAKRNEGSDQDFGSQTTHLSLRRQSSRAVQPPKPAGGRKWKASEWITGGSLICFPRVLFDRWPFPPLPPLRLALLSFSLCCRLLLRLSIGFVRTFFFADRPHGWFHSDLVILPRPFSSGQPSKPSHARTCLHCLICLHLCCVWVYKCHVAWT